MARRAAPVPALVDVDLTIDAARLTAVRGRSGAGKSSLLSLAAGLERPISGRVVATPGLAGGVGPTAAPSTWASTDLAARIAWVPQRAALTIVGSTVLDSLLATGRALGRPEDEVRSGAESLLADLRLQGLEDRNPHTLSGGELRRLALASGLVHGPSVLALDEPTVGQDRHTWAAVVGLCAAAAGVGMAVLVSTHDDDLARTADATHVLDAGRLAGVGA
ncbi:hypothetical protein GCM10025883_42680 [Mobilicoccus caccae]|uniref:ABC transporter domain-containing protein n=1 Tax=Mobilicoccus caccae TaxID=1859295 RepID=A0ABQ6IY13_9MICO|nr:hypothetical protein GCM10025883_42680 [Mobilicoccus caccae]